MIHCNVRRITLPPQRFSRLDHSNVDILIIAGDYLEKGQRCSVPLQQLSSWGVDDMFRREFREAFCSMDAYCPTWNELLLAIHDWNGLFPVFFCWFIFNCTVRHQGVDQWHPENESTETSIFGVSANDIGSQVRTGLSASFFQKRLFFCTHVGPHPQDDLQEDWESSFQSWKCSHQ